MCVIKYILIITIYFFIIEILLLVFIVYPKIQVIISMNSPMEHALIGVDCTVDLVVWTVNLQFFFCLQQLVLA